MDSFNHNDVYRQKIAPLLFELNAICVTNKVPYFCTLALLNTSRTTKYKSQGNLPGSMQIHLTEDYFPKYLAVSHGFDVVHPSTRINFEKYNLDDIDLTDIDDTAGPLEESGLIDLNDLLE